MPVESASASVASRWRAVRRLYPIYAALAVQFNLDTAPYGDDLQNIETRAEPDVLQSVERWLSGLDQRIQAHHLRYLLQSSDVARTEQKLNALVDRYLHLQERGDNERDKLDFLLAHYFSICAPPSFHDREVRLEDVADVLEPLLGEASTVLPDWLAALEELVQALRACTSLAAFEEARIIPRGRQMKISCGQMYFGSSARVAFTRFNYLVRRNAYRLMNADITAAHRSLTQLQSAGVTTVNCTPAHMDAEQSVVSINEMLRNYQTRPFGEYAIDDSIRRVMALRAILERAVVMANDGRVTKLEEQVRELTATVQQLRATVEHQNVVLARLARGAAVAAEAVAAPAPPVAAASVPATTAPAAAPAAEESDPLELEFEILPSPAPQAASPTPPAPAPSVPAAVAAPPKPAPAPPAPVADAAVSAPAAAAATAPAPAGACTSIEQGLKLIAEELSRGSSGGVKKRNVGIRLPATVVLLAEAEINAFFDKPTDETNALRRGAAARVLLIDAMERAKSGDKAGLGPARATVDQESKRVIAAAEACDKAGRTEGAAALRTTARQLAVLLHAAQRS